MSRLAWRLTLLLILCTIGRPVVAQEALIDRLSLDKLGLLSLGATVGRILPSQIEPASLFGISADYGEFMPEWHVVFGVSYWQSRYRDGVVQTFVDTLNAHLDDPTGQAAVLPSRIDLYDVTFSAEARYSPEYSGEIKPYAGVGFAGHVVNAEGPLINGTFVERSLDNIAAGLFVTGGISFRLFSHIGLEGGVRADLLSGFRSTQVRGGATYYFGHVRSVVSGTSGDRGR
jgi:hypothetical protein